jgi:hypothetical protein
MNTKEQCPEKNRHRAVNLEKAVGFDTSELP